MITAIKRILKIVWLSFVAVTAVFFAAILSIQLPQVQTYLVKKVTESLEGKIDGRIVFDKIHLRPFNALVLKNVAVIDDNPLAEGADTLFKAEYIIGRFSLNGLMGNDGLRIGRAYISNAEMTLVIEGDRIVNLTRIFRIPLPDPDKPKNDKPVFKIRRASINDMTFRLKNVWKPYGLYDGYGIDWDNLEVNDINIEAGFSGLRPVVKFKRNAGGLRRNGRGGIIRFPGFRVIMKVYNHQNFSQIDRTTVLVLWLPNVAYKAR